VLPYVILCYPFIVNTMDVVFLINTLQSVMNHYGYIRCALYKDVHFYEDVVFLDTLSKLVFCTYK
jgi:hypothetical protein